MVESKIKQKHKQSQRNPILGAIFMIMKRLQGHSLKDVLNLYTTQFFCLVEMVSEDIEIENKAYKKINSRKRRR